MTGRYGFDQLSNFLMWLSFLLIILAFLSRNPVAAAFFVAIMCFCIIFGMYRMLSRDLAMRARENSLYLAYAAKAWAFFGPMATSLKKWWAGVKATFRKKGPKRGDGYCIFTCPRCGQKVRVPSGKGRIAITCPKCRNEFVEKT